MEENRLVDLETRIAFLEKSWDDLNEVVVEQQQALNRLEQRALRLGDQLQAMREGREETSDSPPPHY